MKELCIVHIGMPKTGSTALQESLSKNIKDKRVAYANLPEVSHSGIIYNMFSDFNPAYYYNAGRSEENVEIANQNNKKLLIAGFKNFDSDIEIISGEDIYHMDNISLIKMRNFLNRYFKKIMIVCYVRAPKPFLESAFQQLVKYHDLGNFDFSKIYHPYKKLQKFDAIFGRENVKLWEFVPEEFPNKDITLDFCQKLDIAYDSDHVLRSNDSISLAAIKLLYSFNKYGTGIDAGIHTFRLKDLLVKSVSKIGTQKLKFSNSLIGDVLKKYKDDYRWINNRMEIGLKEYLSDSEESIDCEGDLLQFSDATIKALEELIKPNILSQKPTSNRIEYVTELMNTLVAKLAKEANIEYLYTNHNFVSEQEKLDFELIKSFNLNWNNFYEKNDIPEKFIHPILYYIRNWEDQNLVIENMFDTFFYLNTYPDIKKEKINPLIHYIQHGIEEGRIGLDQNKREKVL